MTVRERSFELLLINGRGVLNTFREYFDLDFDHCDTLDSGWHPTDLYTGQMEDGVDVVAWSTNIQSSFGVTNLLRQQIAEQGGALAA
jgi:hypothetical protein